MLKSILPPIVAVHEGPIGDIAGPLWSQERALCEGAVDKRQREFAAGRVLAHRALADLGAPEGPLLAVGDSRAPAWPSGFIGAISHTNDYAAAVVASTANLSGIGVDIEHWDRLHDRIEGHILSPGEATRELARLEGPQRQIAAALVFSAKESFYKCQHPLTGVKLGFTDADVEIDVARAGFRLTLLRQAGALAQGRVFQGRCVVAGARVATALWIAADGASAA
jgi:4'-phosphopantetheinyl transferase EntD